MMQRDSPEVFPSRATSLSIRLTWATPGQSRSSFRAVISLSARRASRPYPLSIVDAVSRASSRILRCRRGKGARRLWGEGRLDVAQERWLVLLDEHKGIAPDNEPLSGRSRADRTSHHSQSVALARPAHPAAGGPPCAHCSSPSPLGTAAWTSVRPDSETTSESSCTIFSLPSKQPRTDLSFRAKAFCGVALMETGRPRAEAMHQREILIDRRLGDRRALLAPDRRARQTAARRAGRECRRPYRLRRSGMAARRGEETSGGLGVHVILPCGGVRVMQGLQPVRSSPTRSH